MRIKYICYYNDLSAHRENVQSASTKIDYIVDVLNRRNVYVDVISKTPVSAPLFSLSLGGCSKKQNNTIRHFLSFGCKKILPLYLLSRALNTIHFFLWMLFNTHRGEQVIVYHSLGYTMSLLLLIRLKGLNVIGEIEEIYQDVHKQYVLTSWSEFRFIKECKKYIFPTQLLNEKLNMGCKPSIVIHGVYKSAQITEHKFCDGKIHVVYGGTLDPQKGGAAAAVAAAEFLPSNYHVHICGFGNPSQIKHIVKEVSAKSKAVLTFEGELKGDDYRRFIQKCHIGLSTQNPNAAFNATSFPSKVLVYLANGLQVVSVDIPVVKQSKVAQMVSFYKEQTPEQIATAVKNVGVSCYNTNELLHQLDIQFESQIISLIEASV